MEPRYRIFIYISYIFIFPTRKPSFPLSPNLKRRKTWEGIQMDTYSSKSCWFYFFIIIFLIFNLLLCQQKICILFYFKFYFIFKLYNIVLVLPNIEMNLPQVYTCSPSWTLLPPPSPYHPSGSSQCTSPKHPVSCIEPGPAGFRTTHSSILA